MDEKTVYQFEFYNRKKKWLTKIINKMRMDGKKRKRRQPVGGG